ncbi:MAG TPA: hypothetical protein VFJ17_05140 [Mycobacteriales bacterium]|nr:hypothetical protein [Mycobacteriales bacterium]
MARRHARSTLTVVVALATLAAGCAGSPAHPHRSASRPAPHGRLVVKVVRLPWQLPRPVARSVALTDGSRVLLAGGLTVGDVSSSGVYGVDVATGRTRQLGTLAQPVHDAAGALIDGNVFVFGGGAQSTTAAVQEVVAASGHGKLVGQLPTPRSDLSSAGLGGRTILLGGYTGSSLATATLSTSNGKSVAKLAALPVPIRYGATVSDGHHIWVFGGASGTQPVDDIQRIDSSGAARVIGHLPHPLTEATALDVGGKVLIAGGRTSPTSTSNVVYAFDPATSRVRTVAHLAVPVADAGGVVVNGAGYLLGGENSTQVGVVQKVTVSYAAAPRATATSTAAAPAAPFSGRLLIADRGNDRLLVVDAAKHVLWRYPTSSRPGPPGGFYFPDDAFFVHHGTGIISNQEGNNTIVEIGYPSGRILWSYGHAHVAGAGPGYLNQPDDAYLLSDGRVVVSDASNCRIVIVSPKAHQVGQIGTAGSCTHHPPTSLGYPNGDTPLPDGNLLVSEIHGSWISEYTLAGHLVWTVQLPTVSYPSDPQQIGPDRYLLADYARPGGLVEFDRAGRILWRYQPRHGSRMLDHPSLAEVLPGGFIAVNDDYRQRVVIIDPTTKRIVWQYGHTDVKGRHAGYLDTPDGFDLLSPTSTTPTHPNTG